MRLMTFILLLVCGVTTLRAEELTLIDGRYLHVKFLEVNEKGIRAKLLDTGGEIFIAWGLIHEVDRARVRRDYGLDATATVQIPVERGHRVVGKTGDPYDGRIESETAEAIVIKHRGGSITLPKASIREVEEIDVPVTEIYSAEEYYGRRVAELNVPEDDIPGNIELAEVANMLGLYDKAWAHFKIVQAADPGYQPEFVANQMKRLEELQKHKALRETLDQARRLTMFKQFAKAIEMLDQLSGVPNLPEAIKGEADVLKQNALKVRHEHYRLEVRKLYEAMLKNKIREMARNDRMKLDEARRRLRAELHKEVIMEVATKLAIEPKEADALFEERNWHQARIASYGSGSFIVLGKSPNAEKYEQDMNRYRQNILRQQQGRNQGGSFSVDLGKFPKPPTREEWWEKISVSSEREQWMLAFWVENAKKVKVVGDRWEDCSRCGATGALKFDGSQGEVVRSTCPSCQGHKRYKGVAYK